MVLSKIMNQYYLIKKEIEVKGERYGLTDSRTISLSKELDSLVDAMMTLKHPGSKKLAKKN